MGGPTLDDVTKAKCPDDRPYKCLPDGMCFGPDSFCSPKSQTVESCFPHHLSTFESKLAYCQNVGQNLTQLLHPSCRYACNLTISERSDKSVSESSSDDLKWQIIAIVALILLAVLLVERFTQKTKWRKKMCQKVTSLCQKTSKDDYVLAVEPPNGEEPENNDLGVQRRNADDQVVHRQHPHTVMAVGEATQPETRIQNPPQQNSTQQHVLETTNSSPQLQQPSMNNTVHEEMASSSDSLLNGSYISSTPSSSSVSTSNDSGVNSGREGRIDRENLTQQSPQTCVMTNQLRDCNQQSQRERRADASFHTNTSTPDAESSLVTSATVYRGYNYD